MRLRKLLRGAAVNVTREGNHALERKRQGVHGDEAAEAPVHALRGADAAVEGEPDVESFNLFIERPELPQPDILIQHVGGHHNTDKAKLFHRAARFLDRGADVLQRHQCHPS